MLASLSVYGISNTNNTNQSQTDRSSERSFSEKVTNLNQEIRLNYIKLAEQSLQPQQKPTPENKPANDGGKPAPKTDEGA